MAKNYILQLEEVEFNNDFIAFLDDYFPDGFPDFTGTTLEVGDVKFLYAGIDATSPEYYFTTDGNLPESDDADYCIFTVMSVNSENRPVIEIYISKYSTPGTLPVYLYTEEQEQEPSWAEKVGLPEMNVVHEHKETAKNDIEEIIQAIYSNIGTDENSEMEELDIDYPGYSPMDRLVIAVALYFEDDVNAVLAAGYPNQLKKIAAIIRGDVLSDSSILDPDIGTTGKEIGNPGGENENPSA